METVYTCSFPAFQLDQKHSRRWNGLGDLNMKKTNKQSSSRDSYGSALPTHKISKQVAEWEMALGGWQGPAGPNEIINNKFCLDPYIIKHYKVLFALYLNTPAPHRRFVHQLKKPLTDHMQTFHTIWILKTFCVLHAEEGLLSQASPHPWATAVKAITLNLGEALGIQQVFPYSKHSLKTPALPRVLAQHLLVK